MMPADDELLLRAALDDLTSDQPPAPGGRYSAIRRKAAVRRRHQVMAAAIAALAAAALAVGLAQLPRILRSSPPAHHGALQLPAKMSGLPMPVGTNFPLLVSTDHGAAWYSTATRRSDPVTGLPASLGGYQFIRVRGGWAAVSYETRSSGNACPSDICAGRPKQFYFIADGSLAATRIGLGFAGDGVVASSRPGAVWLATYPRATTRFIDRSPNAQLVTTTGRPLGPRYRLPYNYFPLAGVGRYLLLFYNIQNNLSVLWDPGTGQILRHFANILATGREQIAWSPGCRSCRVQIMNVSTGTTVTTQIPGRDPAALIGAFSDDGRLLAVQRPGRDIQVFDTASRTVTAIPGTALSSAEWQQIGWQAGSHRLVISAGPHSLLGPAQVAYWQPGDARLHVATIRNPSEISDLHTGAIG